jgi:hypothetical protein
MMANVIGKAVAAWVFASLPPSVAPTVSVPEKPVAVRAILGVEIGASLQEAHTRLDTLGEAGGRDTREGGRKEVWTLKETEFSSIALKTNKAGKTVWVTGFVRPGKEIPFSQLGKIAVATLKSETEIVWNVASPKGDYRLVAKGRDGKAFVIYLLSLARPLREEASPPLQNVIY